MTLSNLIVQNVRLKINCASFNLIITVQSNYAASTEYFHKQLQDKPAKDT